MNVEDTINDTQEQRNIYNYIKNERGDLLVLARAGTGKTTTMERALRFIPRGKSVLILAFNKSVAEEFNRRIKRAGFTICEALTCHKYGLRVIREAYRNAQIDTDKYIKLIRNQLGIHSKAEQFALLKACSLARNLMISSIYVLRDAYFNHGHELPATSSGRSESSFFQNAINLTAHGRQMNPMTVDFDDMVWFPQFIQSRFFEAGNHKYDYVIVDEFQDLVPAQVNLVMQALKPNGRLIAIGDDRQTIYGFRGASGENIAQLNARRPNVKTLPLTTTFRCAKSIVSVAREFVPDITAAEGAPDGTVSEAEISACLEGAEYGDFILSRTNAPLVKCALKLMATDCQVAILGRDIASGLRSLIMREKGRVRSIDGFVKKIVEWRDRAVAAHMGAMPPRESAAGLAVDQAECLIALAAASSSIEELMERIDRLFSSRPNKQNCVTLATTHQAKGLERNRVWVLRDTYMRPNRLGQVSQEEKNLYYVAVTRARRELNIVRGLPGEAA
jgi:superfamily I DNA/RNA helicase